MIKPLKWLLSILIFLLMLVALLVGVVRVALPLVPGYKAQIQQELTRLLQRPVAIERLEAKLYGLDLNLSLGAVRLPSANENEALVFSDFEVGLDVLRSLLTLRPYLNRVILRGTRLDIRRSASGDLYLQGKKIIFGADTPLRPILINLFDRGDLLLQDVELHLQDDQAGGAPWTMNHLNFAMRNDQGVQSLSADFRLPKEIGQTMQIAADIRGDLTNPKTWSGKVYLEAKSVDLSAQWLRNYRINSPLVSGSGDLALWSSLDNGRLMDTKGTFAARQVRMHSVQTKDQSVLLEYLAGKFIASKVGTDILVQLEDLQVAGVGRGAQRTKAAFTLYRDQERKVTAVAGRLDSLPLALDSPLLLLLHAYLPKLIDPLASLDPKVNLKDIAFWYDPAANAPEPVLYRLRLENFRVTSKDKIPGVAGLDVSLSGGLNRGMARILSSSLDVDYPRVFRSLLPSLQVDGEIYWSYSADRWEISSDRIHISNADLAADTRFHYQKPASSPKGMLDLEAKAARFDFAKSKVYLPAGIFKEPVVKYLDGAIVSGKLIRADFIFLGKLDQFPYRNHEGTFNIGFSADQAMYDYFPGWPGGEDIQIDALFQNQTFTASIPHGRIYDTEVNNVQLKIPDMRFGLLSLQGESHGAVEDLIRYSQNSPLKNPLAFLSPLQAVGDGSMQLALELPLTKELIKKRSIKGSIQLSGNQLVHTEQNLKLDKLVGNIAFTQDSVTATGLQAKFLNKPILIQINSETKATGRDTRVLATGNFNVQDFTPLIGDQIAKNFAGESDWKVSFSQQAVPQAKEPSPLHMQITSDLEGISSSLPEPFAKPAPQKTALQVTSDSQPQGFTQFDIDYAGLANIALEVARDQESKKATLKRGQLAYGKAKAQLPEGDYFEVTGQLGKVDPMAWLDWQPKVLDETSSAIGIPLLVNLNIESMTIVGQEIQHLSLRAKKQDRSWLAALDSEVVRGNVRVNIDKNTGTSLVLDLDYLRLKNPWYQANQKKPAVGAVEEIEEAIVTPLEPVTKSTFNPGKLPALQLQSKAFYLGDLALGAFHLSGHPGDSLFQIDALSTKSKSTSMQSSGTWTNIGGNPVTDLHLNLDSKDIEGIIKGLGFTAGVKSDRTRLDLDVNWLGTPMDFKPGNMEGLLHAKLSKGQILELKPGAGRVIGLLSLQSLPRRLQLDFSDLFAQGFSFDKVEGNFDLMEGDAYTSNLRIESPSALLEVSGRTGIRTRDYDQLIRVTPKVSSTLPLIGSVVGGPGVGAAVYLAERILKQNIDKIGQYDYSITGTWAVPKVEKVSGKMVVDKKGIQ